MEGNSKEKFSESKQNGKCLNKQYHLSMQSANKISAEFFHFPPGAHIPKKKVSVRSGILDEGRTKKSAVNFDN